MIDKLLHNPYFLTGIIILALLLAFFIVGVVSYGLNVRNRIFRPIIITLLLLAVYRLLWNIPLPGIVVSITEVGRAFSDPTGIRFIGEALTILSGGSFITGSVLSLGLLPLCTAQMIAHSIGYVRDLPLKVTEREGQEILTKWTLYLIVPCAILETLFLLFLLTPLCQVDIFEIFYKNNAFDWVFVVRTFTTLIAGSFFALWISELISEHGFRGQGTNLIIFSGIISEITREFANMFSGDLGIWGARLIYGLITIACIFALIFLVQARREVPIVFPGRRQRNSTFPIRGTLPLSVNLSSDGMLGISILLVFSYAYIPLLTCVKIHWLQQFAYSIMSIFTRNIHLFGPVAFVVILLLTFMFTENQFNASYYVPRLISNQAEISGITDRNQQHYYLKRIQRIISIPNAIGLGVISIVPWAFSILTHSNVSLLDAQRWILILVVVRDGYLHIQANAKLYGYHDNFLVRG